MMTSAEIERHIFHLKAVAGQADNAFACGFARSILKQSKRKGWQPSPAQWRVMQQIVADHLSGDLVLVEDH